MKPYAVVSQWACAYVYLLFITGLKGRNFIPMFVCDMIGFIFGFHRGILRPPSPSLQFYDVKDHHHTCKKKNTEWSLYSYDGNINNFYLDF